MDPVPLLLHFLKALALAVVMYFSMRYLGFPTSVAMMFSLLPLCLGSLNILTKLAYSLTALVFIAAISTSLMTVEQVQSFKTSVQNLYSTILSGKAK